jgi:hypothetical protein
MKSYKSWLRDFGSINSAVLWISDVRKSIVGWIIPQVYRLDSDLNRIVNIARQYLHKAYLARIQSMVRGVG